MFVPALLLVALAIAIGWIPHIHQQFRVAAYTTTDHSAYLSRVLDGAHIPDARPARSESSLAGSLARSLGTTFAALALAAWTLSPKWPRRKKQPYALPLRGPLYALRAIHTGHIGDYIAFLTFGVAAVGLCLLLLIRSFGA